MTDFNRNEAKNQNGRPKKTEIFIPVKISHKLTGYHGWDSIFMIIIISRKKLGGIEL